MPELKHRKPCNECPYRRKAAPGWLGASTAAEFMSQTLGAQYADNAMPCHCAINYEDKDWRTTQFPGAPICAGWLQFLANWCKMPYDPVLGDALVLCGTSADVFANPKEFLAHHDPDLNVDDVMFVGNRLMVKQPDGTWRDPMDDEEAA